jgi:hypothetical protein
MLANLIALLLTVPILALGTWLYLRRRTQSPRVRMALMLVLFLFILVSGPLIFFFARGGRQALGPLPLLWITAAAGAGVQLFWLWRGKGQSW